MARVSWPEVPGVLLFVSILIASSAPAIGADDATAVKQSDVCKDDGAGLQCPASYVVHVHGVQCADGSHACDPAVLDTLFRLCEGRTSCAELGLRNVFNVNCGSPVAGARSLVVTFTCEHAPSPAPACRANLCSNVTQGLSCPEDSVLHVRNLTCQTGLVTCSPATFLTLYSLCEGRRECDASGLRTLMPVSMYCGQSASPELCNVFVDYLCVPKALVRNRCEGRYQSLTEPFGVLMNPGFAGRTPNTGMQCNWFLTPEDKSRVVHVVVHMAYSKWSATNCTTNFLQVRHKDCAKGEWNTTQFCDLSHVNSPITSCGPVHVTSWLPTASDQADRFLVSYQIVPRGSGVVTPGGMAQCSTPLVTPLPALVTTRPTIGARRNYGPGGTMFDYSDTIRQTAEDSKADEHPSQGTFQFKLIILYVFFGVVILALVIALVYVLVSYRGISRRGRHQGDSSEKAALWRHDDTPLDTFSHNSHASLADAANSNAHHHTQEPAGDGDDPATPDSQVVACTVHAESTDEEENRFSSGSGFSSFLSSKDSDLHDLLATLNPYASVPDGPRGGSLPRGWGRDRKGGAGAGGSRGSTRSGSFQMNGELGNIYEAIDTQRYRDHSQHNGFGSHHHHHHHQEEEEEEEAGGEQLPLVKPQPPPSPPLPPPPPPIAVDYDPSQPTQVDHYTVNDDEYALVRKPKSRLSHRAHGAPSARPTADYTNVPCVLRDGGNTILGPDPTYDSVDIFRDKAGPVVGFRPTSGPYDRDRNSKSEPVSPSSGGASRHRWDEL